MARIGLLGGSFNPAHAGHRRISLAAIDALGLDEAWWLVSPGNPLKEGAKDMAPFEARLASAREASKGAPIRVSDFEERQGTRYTVDTVRKLKRTYPQHQFIRKRHPAKFSQMARLERFGARSPNCGDSPARL